MMSLYSLEVRVERERERETEMREEQNQPEAKELNNCCTLPLVINTAS